MKLGASFRVTATPDASCGGRALPRADLCGAAIGRVLVDHGAYVITPTRPRHCWHRQTRPGRSWRCIRAGRSSSTRFLACSSSCGEALGGTTSLSLVAAARREALFPVAIGDNNTAKRISTQDATCFYPPRFLHGEVPLEGLCFLLQELCWGDLTPKERNIELQRQMEAWKALFDIREFKFPEVMRASVLPALDLERDTDERIERTALQDLDRLAAICQLAGRTPNANAPLPYERLKTNRALFNLSRLDVPCRGTSDGEVKWVPAYGPYFGSDWLGPGSVECILEAVAKWASGGSQRSTSFWAQSASVACWNGTVTSRTTRKTRRRGDVGEDEVSVDEDDEVALDADDQERWLRFFQWLGVNASLRPVHFHDVEDQRSGWLKTHNLRRPDGWAFQNMPADLWTRYRRACSRNLVESDAGARRQTPSHTSTSSTISSTSLRSRTSHQPSRRRDSPGRFMNTWHVTGRLSRSSRASSSLRCPLAKSRRDEPNLLGRRMMNSRMQD